MAGNETNPQGSPPDAEAPNFTETKLQQLADELMGDLDAFAAKVPDLEEPHAIDPILLKSNRGVPDSLLGSAIAAVAQQPELQGVNKLSVPKGRETIQYIDAIRPIEDRLGALWRSVHYTIEMKKAELAGQARTIYRVSKGLVDTAGGAPLPDHILNMQRDYGRSRPKKREPKKPDTPATPPGNSAPPSTVPGSGGAQK
jgi:hypothetical protein